MENNRKLTIEEKIKQIRFFQDITQNALAEALGCSDATISRIEDGKTDYRYTDKQIKDARKLFGLENAPLLDDEIAPFKERIYLWVDQIKDGYFTQAQKTQEELSIITQLPFEQDLIILYKLVQVRLLVKEGKKAEANENLSYAEPLLEKSTVENKYHFYCSMGLLRTNEGNFEEGLSFLTKANDLEVVGFKKEPSLNFNLALCEAKFGRYYLAIILMEQVYHVFNVERASVAMMLFNNNLAINYTKIGYFKRANELLAKTLSVARSIGDKTFIGYALHNHGYLYLKRRSYKEAIEYFNQAFEYFTEGNNRAYLENSYYKIRSLISNKDSASKTALTHAKSVARDNEHFVQLFNALTHLTTLKADDSLEYIENTTIPYLLSRYDYAEAMDYYEVLEKEYERRSNLKTQSKTQMLAMEMKALKMKASAGDIHKIMRSGR